MRRLTDGWWALHREIENSWVWADSGYLQAWIYALNRTAWDQHRTRAGVELEAGEVILSYGAIATGARLTRKRARGFIAAAIGAGDLTQVRQLPKRGGTVYRVTRWAEFQGVAQAPTNGKSNGKATNGKAKANGKDNGKAEGPRKRKAVQECWTCQETHGLLDHAGIELRALREQVYTDTVDTLYGPGQAAKSSDRPTA